MQIIEPDTKKRHHTDPEGHRSVEASQVDVLRNERIVVVDTHQLTRGGDEADSER
jgi:hypothetical protein